jgi:hypothetical protein
LPSNLLRNDGAPALEYGHGIENGDRAGGLVDLERDCSAARGGVSNADPLEEGWRKRNGNAVEEVVTLLGH